MGGTHTTIRLPEALRRREKRPPRRALRLPVSTVAGGLRAGVDLNSTADLLDLLEHRW